eukprot:TRINITY_DN5858_c0_g1_i1.p1 TRINITY_DN5858_c0_g1~~TRINITY_DN5858_c0_g1_i1.p1  ORF type:complete len:220 (-),score=48.12 TRINITY_DN5858_c0_g1_i1:99-758(-)
MYCNQRIGDHKKNLHTTGKVQIKKLGDSATFNLFCLKHEINCMENCSQTKVDVRGSYLFRDYSVIEKINKDDVRCKTCGCTNLDDHIQDKQKYVIEEHDVLTDDPRIKSMVAQEEANLAQIKRNMQAINQDKDALDAQCRRILGELSVLFKQMKGICRKFNFYEELRSAVSMIDMRLINLNSSLGDENKNVAAIEKEISDLDKLMSAYQTILNGIKSIV